MYHIKLIEFLHSKTVLGRRVSVLSKEIVGLIPKKSGLLLDIGCGDGLLSFLIMKVKPKLKIIGLDVLKRKKCAIKYKIFNGEKIPFKKNSVDISMMVDMLHHTPSIPKVLVEAKRVSKRYIIIKDHTISGILDFYILKFMDWVGNKPYGVNLIYNYQKKEQWLNLFKKMQLKVLKWHEDIPIYPPPFNQIFGRNLHFIALLEKDNSKSQR